MSLCITNFTFSIKFQSSNWTRKKFVSVFSKITARLKKNRCPKITQGTVRYWHRKRKTSHVPSHVIPVLQVFHFYSMFPIKLTKYITFYALPPQNHNTVKRNKFSTLEECFSCVMSTFFTLVNKQHYRSK